MTAKDDAFDDITRALREQKDDLAAKERDDYLEAVKAVVTALREDDAFTFGSTLLVYQEEAVTGISFTPRTVNSFETDMLHLVQASLRGVCGSPCRITRIELAGNAVNELERILRGRTSVSPTQEDVS